MAYEPSLIKKWEHFPVCWVWTVWLDMKFTINLSQHLSAWKSLRDVCWIHNVHTAVLFDEGCCSKQANAFDKVSWLHFLPYVDQMHTNGKDYARYHRIQLGPLLSWGHGDKSHWFNGELPPMKMVNCWTAKGPCPRSSKAEKQLMDWAEDGKLTKDEKEAVLLPRLWETASKKIFLKGTNLSDHISAVVEASAQKRWSENLINSTLMSTKDSWSYKSKMPLKTSLV